MIAFAIFAAVSGKASVSGVRRTLVGAARVKVLDVQERGVLVRVLDGSGISVGSEARLPAGDVYASPEEIDYFGDLVGFLWGGVPCKDRPPTSLASG